jgi:hypothetical protein
MCVYSKISCMLICVFMLVWILEENAKQDNWCNDYFCSQVG